MPCKSLSDLTKEPLRRASRWTYLAMVERELLDEDLVEPGGDVSHRPGPHPASPRPPPACASPACAATTPRGGPARRPARGRARRTSTARCAAKRSISRSSATTTATESTRQAKSSRFDISASAEHAQACARPGLGTRPGTRVLWRSTPVALASISQTPGTPTSGAPTSGAHNLL